MKLETLTPEDYLHCLDQNKSNEMALKYVGNIPDGATNAEALCHMKSYVAKNGLAIDYMVCLTSCCMALYSEQNGIEFAEKTFENEVTRETLLVMAGMEQQLQALMIVIAAHGFKKEREKSVNN